MEKVQTYTPIIDECYGYYVRMELDDSGEWVRYEDYKELAQELQDLRYELKEGRN